MALEIEKLALFWLLSIIIGTAITIFTYQRK